MRAGTIVAERGSRLDVSCFVDTNVLVYARDASEPEKQQAAERWAAVALGRARGR